MQRALLITVAISLIAVGQGVAQETLPTMPAPPTQVFLGEPIANPPRITASMDYLLWWMSPSPISVPLVATGAAVGDPAATVRIGNSSYSLGSFSGGRLGLGWWLDDARTFGLEGGGFLLQTRSRDLQAASNAVGAPLLYFPYQNTAGTETGVVISNPATGTRGNVRVTLDNRLWGAHVNTMFNTWQGPAANVDILFGFRYYDLIDELTIVSNSENTRTNSSYAAVEHFRTRNQFYGGQLGARVYNQWDRVSLDVTGLIALGATQQLVGAVGTSNFFGPGAAPSGIRSGFLYTQATNIRTDNYSQFSVVPQVQAKLSYNPTQRWRATFGYDFLFWNNVVRAGQQIDHTINATQLSPNLGGAGTLAGAANPAPQRNIIDFWAHGVSFGLEYRWYSKPAVRYPEPAGSTPQVRGTSPAGLVDWITAALNCTQAPRQ